MCLVNFHNLLGTRYISLRADFFLPRKVFMSEMPACKNCQSDVLVVLLPDMSICFECFIKFFYSQHFQYFTDQQKTNVLRSLRSMLEILDMEYKESIKLKEGENHGRSEK